MDWLGNARHGQMGRLGPGPSSARESGWCPGEHTDLTFCRISRVCEGALIGILLAIMRRPPAPVRSCPCPSSRMPSKGYDRGKTVQHRLDDARSQPRDSISHICSLFHRSRSFVVGESSRNAFCQYVRTDGPWRPRGIGARRRMQGSASGVSEQGRHPN